MGCWCWLKKFLEFESQTEHKQLFPVARRQRRRPATALLPRGATDQSESAAEGNGIVAFHQ